MKPRIYKRNGLWHCRVPGSIDEGLGYSPRMAYLDWLRA
jgi:hypothetical protein